MGSLAILGLDQLSLTNSLLAVLNAFLAAYTVRGIVRLRAQPVKSPDAEFNQQKFLLIRQIRECRDPKIKPELIAGYEKLFAKSDIADLGARKKSLRLSALRRISALGTSTILYEIKRLIEEKDDVVALYAFRALVKNSNAMNEATLVKMITRSEGKQFLLASCLGKIAKSSNAKILCEILTPELPEAVYVFCLKALSKVDYPTIIPLLTNAQENSSEVIQNAAAQILAGRLKNDLTPLQQAS